MAITCRRAARLLRVELVGRLKGEGRWVSLWYVHSLEMVDKFKGSGADGFVTGMPSAVREASMEK